MGLTKSLCLSLVVLSACTGQLVKKHNLPVLFQYEEPGHSVAVFRGAELKQAIAAGLVPGFGNLGGRTGKVLVILLLMTWLLPRLLLLLRLLLMLRLLQMQEHELLLPKLLLMLELELLPMLKLLLLPRLPLMPRLLLMPELLKLPELEELEPLS